jgi:hypothetical protein
MGMADTRNGGSKGKTNGSARKGTRRRKQVVQAATAGAALGIGSAALVAALMYANRPKDDEGESTVRDSRFEPRES